MITPVPDLTRTQIDRFHSLVIKADGDGCWLWDGPRTERGYGKICFGSTRKKTLRQYAAHRLAAFLATGEWREQACHDCDNPGCVRPGPGHVYWGNHATNTTDMVVRGRVASGVRNSAARLTPEQVAEIRSEAAVGPWGTQRRLARKHGVSDAAISLIVSRQVWESVA